MVEKALLVFSFDGKDLKPVGTVAVNGGPAGIRTAQKAQ
jgi:hypothetical protein